VSQDFLEQFLNQCNSLEDHEVITNAIKNLFTKLEHKEKSAIFEQLTSDMSVDVKASIVKQLLGDSRLQVTVGQAQVTATNFYNFQSSSPDNLSDVLFAIAEVIRNSQKTTG